MKHLRGRGGAQLTPLSLSQRDGPHRRQLVVRDERPVYPASQLDVEAHIPQGDAARLWFKPGVDHMFVKKQFCCYFMVVGSFERLLVYEGGQAVRCKMVDSDVLRIRQRAKSLNQWNVKNLKEESSKEKLIWKFLFYYFKRQGSEGTYRSPGEQKKQHKTNKKKSHI